MLFKMVSKFIKLKYEKKKAVKKARGLKTDKKKEFNVILIPINLHKNLLGSSRIECKNIFRLFLNICFMTLYFFYPVCI